MSYNRITVPLSESEEEALRRVASMSCRRPRDHARYIILKSLGLVTDDGPSLEKNTRYDAKTLGEHNIVAGVGINP